MIKSELYCFAFKRTKVKWVRGNILYNYITLDDKSLNRVSYLQFLYLLTCREKHFLSYLGLTLMKTAPHNSLSSFLLLHVPDVFLINGKRMDGLTEGPDNNG